MSRNSKSAKRKFDWRMVIFLIISLMIVVTMVLAYFPNLGK